jgi:hypothetical protein
MVNCLLSGNQWLFKRNNCFNSLITNVCQDGYERATNTVACVGVNGGWVVTPLDLPFVCWVL